MPVLRAEETLESLRYADRAKRVKNKAVVNVDPTELLTNQLKEENKKLMEQLQAMMKDGTLPSEPTDETGMPISEEEREEMRRQLQSVARTPGLLCRCEAFTRPKTIVVAMLPPTDRKWPSNWLRTSGWWRSRRARGKSAYLNQTCASPRPTGSSVNAQTR
jgi:hypothetical protein